MTPYKSLAVNASDAELGGAYQEKTRSAGQRGWMRRMDAERWKAMAVPALGSLLVLVLLWRWAHPPDMSARRESFGPPSVLRVVRDAGTVPNASTLLTADAPARSYFDALRPDLRYLTLDSWSGWSGQVLTAFSLLYLAHLTQRVAIVPSFRDNDHYGDSMITLDLLLDMEKFRQERGALFVNWDDVKPLDRVHAITRRDEIGCYMGNNPFEGGRSFDEHNLEQTIWRVPRANGWFANAVESFVLWDFDEEKRINETRIFGQKEKRKVPANMLDSQLLCYSNLWDLSHAGAMATGWSWSNSFKGHQELDGDRERMLAPEARGTHPEWWAIGQYIDFKEEVWEIAKSCVRRTLDLAYIPKHLITVHLRRGDFKTWCSSGNNCTPAIGRYVELVDPLLAESPTETRVLVTTDEQDDIDFLSHIDSLGWFRIDHRALNTTAVLEEKYGDAARWADAAIDQAILSLGMHFVGTSGSQVSLLSELRVAAWNGGKTSLVERPQ